MGFNLSDQFLNTQLFYAHGGTNIDTSGSEKLRGMPVALRQS